MGVLNSVHLDEIDYVSFKINSTGNEEIDKKNIASALEAISSLDFIIREMKFNIVINEKIEYTICYLYNDVTGMYEEY